MSVRPSMETKTWGWPFLCWPGDCLFWRQLPALVSPFKHLLPLREDTLHQVHGGLHLALVENVGERFVLPHDVPDQLLSLLILRQSCGYGRPRAAGLVSGRRWLTGRSDVVSDSTHVNVSLGLWVRLRSRHTVGFLLAGKGTEDGVVPHGPETAESGHAGTFGFYCMGLALLQKRKILLLCDFFWVDNPDGHFLHCRSEVSCHMLHPEIQHRTISQQKWCEFLSECGGKNLLPQFFQPYLKVHCVMASELFSTVIRTPPTALVSASCNNFPTQS